jgi:hypothetical protein
MKIELWSIGRPIRTSSGQAIYEPFLGSGTALFAAPAAREPATV